MMHYWWCFAVRASFIFRHADYDKDNVAIAAKGLKEGDSVVVKGNERIFPKQAIKSLNK